MLWREFALTSHLVLISYAAALNKVSNFFVQTKQKPPEGAMHQIPERKPSSGKVLEAKVGGV